MKKKPRIAFPIFTGNIESEPIQRFLAKYRAEYEFGTTDNTLVLLGVDNLRNRQSAVAFDGLIRNVYLRSN